MRVDVMFLLAASLLTVPDRPPKPKNEDPIKGEMKKLEGKWSIVSLESNGRKYPPERLGRLNYKLEIKGNHFIRETRGRKYPMTFRIDPSQKPKAIDFTTTTVRARTFPAIYKLEGDTLTICQPIGNGQRPTDFTSQGATRAVLMVWKRDPS